MKRTILILIASLVLCSLHIYAQSDSNDVIYMKHGRVYVGAIFERFPDISYKIELTNGHVMRIYVEDIRQITREPKGKIETYIPKHTPALINIEGSASYIMSFAGLGLRINGSDISHGGGITFLTEIRNKHRIFSFLVGASAQMLSARKFSYYDALSTNGYGNIEKGYFTRFRVPMWFRWTLGNKSLTGFFQFGWALGVDYYEGWGSLDIHGGHCSGCSYTREGWQKFATPVISVPTIGAGIRKSLTPRLQIISYIEGGPLTLHLLGTNTYRPYFQLHCGVNFDTRKK